MKKLLPILLFMLWPIASSAQLYAIRDSVANGYNFWLHVPSKYKDYRAERRKQQAAAEEQKTSAADTTAAGSAAKKVVKVPEPLPIVIFLHGRSLSGTNLYTVLKYGTVDALEAGRKINAIVIAPQVTMSDWWRPERVMNLVKWVKKRYDVDDTRIYVLGMSLGGYGAIDFAAAYPKQTAAAMALCGGSTRKNVDLTSLNKVPLWIMHGTADNAVHISASRRVRDAMLKADTTLHRLRYDEFEGAGHSIFARTFYLKETYEWLFKHRTTDVGRPVDRSVQILAPHLERKYTYAGLRVNSVKLNIIDPLGEAASATYVAPSAPVYHTIAPGETLGHIAIKYNTTVKRLCELNNITETTIIKSGKKLKVSSTGGKATSSSAKSSKTAKTTTSAPVYHTIAPGETLGHIAIKYNTTVKRLCELNSITETTIIKSGKKLKVSK